MYPDGHHVKGQPKMEEMRRFFGRHASLRSHPKATSEPLISGEERRGEVGYYNEDQESTRIYFQVRRIRFRDDFDCRVGPQ